MKSQTISLSGWLTIVRIYKHRLLYSFMQEIYFTWRFCFLRYVHVFILLKLPIFKKWQDDRLIWTPASYGDIDMIFTAPSKIWKPEIIVENSLVFICSFAKFSWILLLRMFENVFVCFYTVFMRFFYYMRPFHSFHFSNNRTTTTGRAKAFIISNL